MAIPVWQPGTLYPNGSVVLPTVPISTNLASLLNPGFDDGNTTGWTITTLSGTDVPALSNLNPYNGSFCLSLQSTGGATTVEAINNATPAVTPGAVLSASVQVRLSFSGQSSGRAILRWYTAGMVLISTTEGALIQKPGNSSERWVQSNVTGTAPATAAFVRAGVQFGAGANGDVRIDGMNWSYVSSATLAFKATQSGVGTSDSTEPTWPPTVGVPVNDGTVVWEGVILTRITYKAEPIMKSGATEPTWPLGIGSSVNDNTVKWVASTRQVTQAPNSRVVAITASKVYAADEDIIKFSATVNPLDWTTADDAGYLPSGLNQNGSNDTAVLNIYRSSLVSFSSTTFQNWQVDPDPANMSLLDVMEGIGSTWQHAAQPVAKDLFYLAALGVRTVGISAGSTNLVNGDVGMPIDPLVRASIAQAVADGAEPRGLYYPSLGQYWLSFPVPSDTGDKTVTYVYSMTTLGSVGAWSWYEFPWLVEGEAMLGNEVYLRSGDSVYVIDPDRLDDQDENGDDIEVEAEIQSHYLDMGSPGVTKMLIGVDLVGTGTADIAIGFNQGDLAHFTPDVSVTSDTLTGSIIPIPVSSPSLAMRLRYSSTDNPDGWEWLASNFYINDFRQTS